MLIVACLEMTSGESGVSVEASRVAASCTDKPSSPTWYPMVASSRCGERRALSVVLDRFAAGSRSARVREPERGRAAQCPSA
jgi:hypothetical protein